MKIDGERNKGAILEKQSEKQKGKPKFDNRKIHEETTIIEREKLSLNKTKNQRW